MSIYVRLRVEAVLETAKSGFAALLASFLRHARKTRQSRSEMTVEVHSLMQDADDGNFLGRFSINDEMGLVRE
ncbi:MULTISPECIES: hypothetical protein [unclassified Neorhizobium]|uniref:hypothetical protein n=1 Tax=unclassified Neorhizobium TaxID=2629175 RepID=UPI001FF2E82F|nr:MULTISPECIES: hypothetical protein [unclassified Neorhizobium]MCJ9673538.1 hypothetical protein [Neorhizobium sp. SHOUNA12B]MCJ9746426.1 hypothetical protein [Neorhizobium sp. SHOUNA12A]